MSALKNLPVFEDAIRIYRRNPRIGNGCNPKGTMRHHVTYVIQDNRTS